MSRGSRSAACWCGSCGGCGGASCTRRLGPDRARSSSPGTLLTGIAWSSAIHADARSATTRSTSTACSARSLVAVVLTHAVGAGEATAPRRPARRRQVLTSAGVGVGALRALAAAAHARAGRRQAPLHRLLRGRLVRGQRVPRDLVGGGRAQAARRTTALAFGDRRLTAAELDAGDAAHRHARLHRRLLLDAALARDPPGPPARRRARQPRPRDLPHRLPLELRPRRRARPAPRHPRRRRAAQPRPRRTRPARRARPARLHLGQVGHPGRAP